MLQLFTWVRENTADLLPVYWPETITIPRKNHRGHLERTRVQEKVG